jgi:hypothetical protein
VVLRDALDMHRGEAEVTIPLGAAVGGARIKVEASTGHFFALSAPICVAQ